MMTGITPEKLEQLQAPFKVEEHELRDGGRDGKLVYLTEEPLIDRLIEVDPNWEFRIISTIITDYNLTRPDSATVSAELTICGITRGGVGCCVANVKEYDYVDGKRTKLPTPIIYPLSETEIKGAATDALKRCARQFGVGGYLLRTKGVKFSNEGDFARWYAREFSGHQPKPHQNAKTPPKTRDNGSAQSTTQAPPPATENVNSELDDHFGPQMTPAQLLAGDTFPFDDGWKGKDWQKLIKSKPTWNKVFWPAISDLELTDDEVHAAAAVESLNDYKGGVGQLWLAICERKLAKAS